MKTRFFLHERNLFEFLRVKCENKRGKVENLIKPPFRTKNDIVLGYEDRENTNFSIRNYFKIC